MGRTLGGPTVLLASTGRQRGIRGDRLLSPAWTSVQAHADWPVVGRLPTLAAPAPPGEPAAFQVLRRLRTAHAEPSLQALAALPGLGAGDPLGPGIRQPMETLTGRDFARVRVHTAPLAAMLGAEAFTTGQQVVFAPGRLDLRSTRGLALLSHELSHVGQTLAFKSNADLTPEDAEERQARRQEGLVQQIIELGWPAESRMQVRRTAQPAAQSTATGGAATSPAVRREPGQELPIQRVSAAEGNALPFARLRAGIVQPQSSVPVSRTASDVDALAKQIYALLKARLRAERDRHHLYSR